MNPLRLSVAALTLGLALPAQATPRTVEDVLPASTYFCARFGGLDAGSAAADQLAVTALIKELYSKLPAELRQQQIEAHLDRGAQHLRAHAEHAGVSLALVRSVLARPAALGIGRLTLNGMGPSVAAVIDMGQARASVERLWEVVSDMARAHGCTTETTEVDGVQVKVLVNSHGPSIYGFAVGDFGVVTNSLGYLREIRATAAGKQPSLAAASALGPARQSLPQPALLSAFLNTAPLVAMLDPLLPYEAADWGKALGVDGLSGLYLGASGASGGGAEALMIGLSGDQHGLLKAAFSVPASLEAAKWCSKDTVLFGTSTIDVPGVIDAFDRCIDLLPPAIAAKARQEIKRDLGRDMQRDLGMPPEAVGQLVRAFGNNVTLAVTMPAGAALPIPDALLFVEVKDWSRIEPLVEMACNGLAEHANLTWKTRSAGDVEIRYCDVQIPQGPKLSPCFLHKGNQLVVASSMKAMLAALHQSENAADGLVADAEFARAIKGCAGASALVQLRLGRAIELGYQAGKGLLAAALMANSDKLGFDAEMLPDAATLAKVFGTCTLSRRLDDHGLLLRHEGNLGFGVLIAACCRMANDLLERANGKVF